MEPSEYIIEKQREALKEYSLEVSKMANNALEELEHGNLHDVENILTEIAEYIELEGFITR